jgi:hypothetical protein
MVHYTDGALKLFGKAPSLRDRIELVLAYFPDIDSVSFGKASKSAYYDPGSGTVRLTAGSSMYVIAHELTHHLQYSKTLFEGRFPYPKGERACDLFVFARSPCLVADMWDSRDSCYMGKAMGSGSLREWLTKAEGQLLVHRICREALDRREHGHKGYICWAEAEIKRQARLPRNIESDKYQVPAIEWKSGGQ